MNSSSDESGVTLKKGRTTATLSRYCFRTGAACSRATSSMHDVSERPARLISTSAAARALRTQPTSP